MLKDIQVTLYDIFGYLVPGFVSLAALVIPFWGFSFPTIPLPFQVFSEHGLATGVAAYVIGHMTQAIANIFLPVVSVGLYQTMLQDKTSDQPVKQLPPSDGGTHETTHSGDEESSQSNQSAKQRWHLKFLSKV